jgi:hypothetical protein
MIQLTFAGIISERNTLYAFGKRRSVKKSTSHKDSLFQVNHVNGVEGCFFFFKKKKVKEKKK